MYLVTYSVPHFCQAGWGGFWVGAEISWNFPGGGGATPNATVILQENYEIVEKCLEMPVC